MNKSERIKFLTDTIMDAVNTSGIPDLTHEEATAALTCLVNIDWIRHALSPDYVREFCKAAFGVDDVMLTPRE